MAEEEMVAVSWAEGAMAAVDTAMARAAVATAAGLVAVAMEASARAVGSAATATEAAARAAGLVAAATEAVATGSFPNPSSGHSQQRRRPNYPPMRNESVACLRRRRSLRPTDGVRARRGRVWGWGGASEMSCTGRTQVKADGQGMACRSWL